MNLMANRERAVSSLGTGRCPLGQFRNFARCAEIVRRETIAESPSAYRSDASRVSELRAMAQAGRVRIMKSPVAKRSVVINGHKTSVSLEDCVLVGGKGNSSGTGPHALGAHRDGRSRPGRAGQLIVGAAAVRTRAISRRTRACRFAAARTPAPGSETGHVMTGGGFRPTRGLRYRSQPSPRYARKSRFEARKNA